MKTLLACLLLAASTTKLPAQTFRLKVDYYGSGCRTVSGAYQWIAIEDLYPENSLRIYARNKGYNLITKVVFFLAIGARSSAMDLTYPFMTGCQLWVQPAAFILFQPTTPARLPADLPNTTATFSMQLIRVELDDTAPRQVMFLSNTDAATVSWERIK
ncbi:MAG: hypothetical protein R3F30_11305 [Planctomycetota bacterium]